MALQFFTGFDYYNQSQLQRVWPYYSGGTSISPGRFGGMAYGWNNAGGYLATLVPNTTTSILGIAFFLSYGDPTNPIIVLQDSTTSRTNPTTQVDFRVTSDAAFQITRNGTIIGTTLPNLFTWNFWNYLEIKTYIATSGGGYVQIRINGQTLYNVTGLTTQYTGNNFINMVRIQPFGTTGQFNFKIDDMYLADSTGTVNNTFLGECRVQTQFATANGERNDFVAFGAGTNWQCVDDNPVADDDTTYVKSGVVGAIDDYTMGTINLTGTIFGVQANVVQKKDDVGVRTVAPLIKSNGTYFLGTGVTCQSDYTTAQQIWQTEPSASTTWTNASVNALKVGLKITG